MHSWDETFMISENVVIKKIYRRFRKFKRASFITKSKKKDLLLQDKLGKQNFHEDMKNLYKQLIDTIKNTS